MKLPVRTTTNSPKTWTQQTLVCKISGASRCAEIPVAYHAVLEFFDVKFYPYDPVGSDPIFAAVSMKHVRVHGQHVYSVVDCSR